MSTPVIGGGLWGVWSVVWKLQLSSRQAGDRGKENGWEWEAGRCHCRATRSKDLESDPNFHGIQVCPGACLWLHFSQTEARGWWDRGYRDKHPPGGKGPNDIECGRIWQHQSGITGLVCQSSLGEVLEFRVTVEKQSLKCWKMQSSAIGFDEQNCFFGRAGNFSSRKLPLRSFWPCFNILLNWNIYLTKTLFSILFGYGLIH